MRNPITEIAMKYSRVLAVAGLLVVGEAAVAQLPPGVTAEMVASALPEEGAPRAVPGPYAVHSEPAAGTTGLMTFRPASLDRFPAQDKLPVVVWGNGGCAISGPRYYGFLETVASHGFLVVTTMSSDAAPPPNAAPAAGGAAPPARPRQATADDLKAGLDWAERENARAGSPLRGKVDTTQMAAMGQSCGGMLSILLGADPRVDTIGVFNAGVQAPNPDAPAPAPGTPPPPVRPGFDSLPKLHGPVLLINGHERDFMHGPSRATFDAIEHVPAFYGARHGAGHTATAYHPGGGEFANVASNWLRWHFKGDRAAAAMFAGASCALCTNPNWDAAAKRLPR
jgi:dienelactone hydrolase